MHFFVRMEFIWPDWPSEMFAERWQAEIMREIEVASGMMERGNIIRMWRKPGDKGNFSLWKADTLEELHKLLKELPMYRFIKADVTPLMEHELQMSFKKTRGKLPAFPEGF
jgi:muconolactone D-isomerase